MKKTAIKMGIAAAMCGLGLVAGLVPASAFADANSGTTDVKVKTDPASTQLAFEVPTLIQFGVDSAGTLTGPSPEVLNITNKSVFPIHVTNMTATAKDPFVLGDTAAATADNTLDFTIDGHKASAGSTDLSADATFNLGYADSATASHKLTVANGKIVKVNQDLTKNPSVASVTWTLAAGAVA